MTATTTPVDRSHEAPIRDEIRRVNHAIESLQSSLGPIFDAFSDRLALRLEADHEETQAKIDAFFARVELARREDAAAVRLLIDEAEERRDVAIALASAHFSREIARVDGRIDGLDLRVGAYVGDTERDAAREREEVTGTIRVVAQRVDKIEPVIAEHASWFANHKSSIGTGAGGAGLAIAVHSAAPYLVEWARSAVHWITK